MAHYVMYNSGLLEQNLFDILFDASYDEKLTGANPERLKRLARARIRKLTYGLDRDMPADKLVEELDNRVHDYLRQRDGMLFAVEFALNGEGNCVVYSNLVFLSLERLGRRDAMENLWVKHTPEHSWLEYDDGDLSFSINSLGCATDRRYTIEALLATNLVSKGVHLEAFREYEKAIACYDRAISLNPDDYNAWFDKGTALSEIGKYKEAIGCFDAVLKIYPGDSETLRQKKIARELLVNLRE